MQTKKKVPGRILFRELFQIMKTDLIRPHLLEDFEDVRGDGRFSAGRFGQNSSADVADDFAAGAAEDDLFVFTAVAFNAQESAFRTVGVIHFFSLLTRRIRISLL